MATDITNLRGKQEGDELSSNEFDRLVQAVQENQGAVKGVSIDGSQPSYPGTDGVVDIELPIDVVDNLTSTSSTAALSARQGKALNDAVSGKVDKVTGKGLSTNDYTTAEKTKLSGISSGANKVAVTRHETSGTNIADITIDGGSPIKLYAPTAGASVSIDVVDNLTSTSSTAALSARQGKALNDAVSGKVDKVTGKGLSTNDYTTAEKTKLSGLSNYDDTVLAGRVSAIEGKVSGWDAKLSDAPSDGKQYARRNGEWNEVGASADSILYHELGQNTDGSIDQKVITNRLNEKQDIINDLSTIRSNASAGATAYQKPTSGIPKTDLTSSVQLSLGRADTALQTYTETDPTVPSYVKNISQSDISSWNGKQSSISDLATIRSGASKGSTSVQTINNVSPDANGNVNVDATSGEKLVYVQSTEPEDAPVGAIWIKIAQAPEPPTPSTHTVTTYLLSKGYQTCEYLQSTGTQYINTGLVINANDLRIKMTLTPTQLGNSSYSYEAGGAYGNNARSMSIQMGYRTAYSGLGNADKQLTPSFTVTANTQYVIDWHASGGQFTGTINGTSVSVTYSGSLASNQAYYLFAENSSGRAQNQGRFRIGRVEMYLSGTQQRDLIPCYDTTTGAGYLWDRLHDVFYGNAGSGSFTVGNDVTIDDEYDVE